MASSNRLLISHITLRGRELKQLYEQIAACPGISFADLVVALTPEQPETFGLADTTLREALNFLLIASMVKQEGAERRRASFYPTPQLVDAPFALLLLHHIQTHPDRRQQALALIQRLLAAEDILALAPAQVRERMERSPIGSLFAWTGEKVRFWGSLAHYLGVVRWFGNNTDILLVPQPYLLFQALEWIVRGNETDEHHLRRVLDDIDCRFFACYTTQKRVHQGVVQSLLALERMGSVHLSHRADAASSLLLNERRISHFRLCRRIMI
ncbi:MAG: hypothetical protein RMJ55_07115 [Roseiflexaceae bacterium]|nr:hypothetical protein [Roseiflexus sp.]MDW8145906.1 hypothetical protein [Roseiflexaceae bacterium]MDW8213308.1 hypothetical protein [Roseiflexaceae bacterium]